VGEQARGGGEQGAGPSGVRAGRAGRERARPGEGFGAGRLSACGEEEGVGPAGVRDGRREVRECWARGEGEREEGGEKRKERKEKEKGEKKWRRKGKKMGKRKREGDACAPAATAAAVGHARRWSRVRGPGEVRHAERGGHLRQESERPGRACSAEEEREKGGREKKRGREIRGDDRDGWSRVTRAGTAVRKKREGFGRRKKDRWTRRKESGVGKRVFGTGKSFRELGF